MDYLPPPQNFKDGVSIFISFILLYNFAKTCSKNVVRILKNHDFLIDIIFAVTYNIY
jgi:hypothetical protein